jgi:hypothetical protein
MSDFIFATRRQPKGTMATHIQSIYQTDTPEVQECHGAWGSLAISRNLYNGFAPVETPEHIFVVIGGPVLCFQDNAFLTGEDQQAGTWAVYRRWKQGQMRWDEDMSGPFVVLIVDKAAALVSCITDLMMFIPVYKYQDISGLMLGTHIDALARAAKQEFAIDQISLADFVLNNVVTYPYTAYSQIRQCHPSAIYKFWYSQQGGAVEDELEIYWLPEESNFFKNIDEAAFALREGLKSYISCITQSMNTVAQFVSGGEDSRAVLGLLPNHLKRDAYIFLDSMNREGRIAEAVASAYGASFNMYTRSPTYYLDILSEAADLIGSGHQYHHAHTLGFHKRCKLGAYPAVFGGFISDSMLKANYARKARINSRFSFIPKFFLPGETRSEIVINLLFNKTILSGITQRRLIHLEYIKRFRKKTVHEWFVLWPMTMRGGIPYLYCNRRLFRSYEPFMAKEVVKISAAVPTTWKLNRRLFHKAMRPFMKPSKWILHADGRLPYFPWWVNSLVQFSIWFMRGVGKRLDLIKGYQGPWADWNRIVKGPELHQVAQQYVKGYGVLAPSTKGQKLEQLLSGNELGRDQKVNLLQVIYELSRTTIQDNNQTSR